MLLKQAFERATAEECEEEECTEKGLQEQTSFWKDALIDRNKVLFLDKAAILAFDAE